MLLDASGNPIKQSAGGESRPHMREIATIGNGRDITRPFIDEILRPLDEILLTREHTLAAYKRILSDWQAQTAFQQRRKGVISRELEVEPGDSRRASKAAADWLKEMMAHVKWDNVVDKMLYGIHYGHAVGELIYMRDGQHIGVDKIKVRDRERFVFAPDFSLRLRTTAEPYRGEEIPQQNFWVYSTGSDHHDDPYGLGLAHWLYWPVYFKRVGLGYWLKNLERWAQPVPWGKFAPGTPLAEQQKLLHTLYAIQHDAGIITPEDMNVELLEAKRTGTADYSAFEDRMDRAIAKIINSQTLTTESDNTGLGSTQGEVHERVSLAVQRSDAALICESFSGGGEFGEGPLQRLLRWNFPQAAMPKLWYVFPEDNEDLSETVETDTKVHALGFEPSEEYIKEKYGPHWARKAPAQPSTNGVEARTNGSAVNGQAATFAEGEEDPEPPGTVTAYAAQAAAQTAVFDRLMEPIEALLARADSLEQVRDELLELYAEMDAGQLATLLQRALLASELAGRFEVDNETEE